MKGRNPKSLMGCLNTTGPLLMMMIQTGHPDDPLTLVPSFGLSTITQICRCCQSHSGKCSLLSRISNEIWSSQKCPSSLLMTAPVPRVRMGQSSHWAICWPWPCLHFWILYPAWWGKNGDLMLVFSSQKASKSVENHRDGTTAWDDLVNATTYISPHHEKELQEYGYYINWLFKLAPKSNHHHIINFDRAVRIKVPQR